MALGRTPSPHHLIIAVRLDELPQIEREHGIVVDLDVVRLGEAFAQPASPLFLLLAVYLHRLEGVKAPAYIWGWSEEGREVTRLEGDGKGAKDRGLVEAEEEHPEVEEGGGSPLQRGCVLYAGCVVTVCYGGHGDRSSGRVCWNVVAELREYLARWSLREDCPARSCDQGRATNGNEPCHTGVLVAEFGRRGRLEQCDWV